MGIVQAKVGAAAINNFNEIFNITTHFQAHENITEASQFSSKNLSREIPEKEDVKEIDLEGVRVTYPNFILKYLL